MYFKQLKHWRKPALFSYCLTTFLISATSHFFISSRVTSGDSEFFVYFAGTDRGEIYKIARWKSGEGQWRSRLLDVIEGVGAGGAAIR